MEEDNTHLPSYIPYSQKDEYKWEKIYESQNQKTIVYYGYKKNNSNEDDIHIKQININFEDSCCIRNIIKEIYFLILLKNQDSIVHLNDVFFDNEENTKYIFLIFKGGTSSLDKFLHFSLYKEKFLPNKQLISWIIFQIARGIYIIHKNTLIHNDIKPQNILIDQKANVCISDFGSCIYKDEICYDFTNYYAPPEVLLDNHSKRTKKGDIWSFGLVILRIFLDKKEIFTGENREVFTKSIFARFGFNNNLTQNEMTSIMNDDSKSTRKIELTEDEINSIDNNDVLDLIYNMLVLNPEKRYSIDNILESKYFDEFQELKSSNTPATINWDYNKLREENIGQEQLRNIINKLKSNL